MRDETGGREDAEAANAGPGLAEAARRRAAVELVARHGAAVRRTARRYSLCTADAEDAYQRTLEIVLRKAPLERDRDLLAWSRTVAKHEALAIARSRQRLLGTAPRREEDQTDPVALIPSLEDGPEEQLERREDIARSREALRALKPAELRALTLLAQGYTYAEIGEITGYSHTKVNRCLAEGRERFRALFARSEDGSRCEEMAALLSRFCDGETSAAETATVREHLRACPACRAAVRAYRAAPAAIAALTPALPGSRSLLERVQELLFAAQSRLSGLGGADASAAQTAAAGGTRGAGAAALAKLLALCAGTVGGTAACVAVGVAPAPLDFPRERMQAPRIERVSPRSIESPPTTAAAEPAAEEGSRPETPSAPPGDSVSPSPVAPESSVSPVAVPPTGAAAAEYTEAPPPEAPAPPPASEPVEAASSGSAAGEFGP